MPIRLTVEKFHAATGEYWVNVYWLNVADVATAAGAAMTIVEAERNITLPEVTFTKYRVDDGLPNTEQSATVVVNLPGLSATTGDPLPLFVVARVDFSVAGGGRPSRKYLRGVLTEAVVTMTTIAAAQQTAINNYATSVASTSACDVDGQDITGGAVAPQPGMRQLRRGSKKKVIP